MDDPKIYGLRREDGSWGSWLYQGEANVNEALKTAGPRGYVKVRLLPAPSSEPRTCPNGCLSVEDCAIRGCPAREGQP